MEFHLFLKRVGSKIRHYRQKLGLSQVDASARVDIPTRRYQDIEAGKANLTLRTLHRIAKLFGREPTSLFK
jgi:transcriptional regulator with XRE-family HTH domain